MSIDGLILAAGFSKRAGAHKMVLDIEGKTVIERCIEGMYDSCSKIILVGGYRIENLYPVSSRYSKVRLVFNRDYSSGMFSSFKTGLKHIASEKFFFTPGDYPLISSDTYMEMQKPEDEIIVPEFKGLRGHPVLVKSVFIDEILHSSGYSCIRDFINTKRITSINVPDPGILMDIDTISDYKKLLQYYCVIKSKAF